MKAAATDDWVNRVFGGWGAHEKSTPRRCWYPTEYGWASFDRALGYIEHGTAEAKRKAAREAANVGA